MNEFLPTCRLFRLQFCLLQTSVVSAANFEALERHQHNAGICSQLGSTPPRLHAELEWWSSGDIIGHVDVHVPLETVRCLTYVSFFGT